MNENKESKKTDLLYCCSAQKIKNLVAEQAKDEVLWSLPVFTKQGITEAYLQQELRKLHELIECEFGAT